MNTIKKQNIYKYPEWVSSVRQIVKINNNARRQLYVSVLHRLGTVSQDDNLIDIRVWEEEKPTWHGVFVSRSAAFMLRNILDRFINGELVDDSADLN